MKQAKPAPEPELQPEPQSEPTIPITKEELLKLQDIASGLEVLRTIAKSADRSSGMDHNQNCRAALDSCS